MASSGPLPHVMGPGVDNTLPDKVNDAQRLSNFKLKLKNWLAGSALYSFDEFHEYNDIQ